MVVVKCEEGREVSVERGGKGRIQMHRWRNRDEGRKGRRTVKKDFCSVRDNSLPNRGGGVDRIGGGEGV